MNWLKNFAWRVYQYPVVVRYIVWIVIGSLLGAIGGLTVSFLAGG